MTKRLAVAPSGLGAEDQVDFWIGRMFFDAPVRILKQHLESSWLKGDIREFNLVTFSIRTNEFVSAIPNYANILGACDRPDIFSWTADTIGYLGYRSGVRLRSIANSAVTERIVRWDQCMGEEWDESLINVMMTVIDLNGALGVPFAASKADLLTSNGRVPLENFSGHMPGLNWVRNHWLECLEDRDRP